MPVAVQIPEGLPHKIEVLGDDRTIPDRLRRLAVLVRAVGEELRVRAPLELPAQAVG